MTEEKKDIGRFFKHSYIYALGNIINRVGAFILLPVYTNYLTPEEYGALELFYGVSSVVFGFLSIGIAHATLRFYFEFDEPKEQHAVVSTNYLAALFISLIGVLIVAIWYQELTELVFHSRELEKGILIILGTIVFELSSQICLAYVRAVERSLLFVYIAIAKLLVQVALNVYLVIYANQGIIGILTGNLMAVFLGWLVLSWITLKDCGFRFDTTKLKSILLYSYPFIFGTITELVSTNVDKFSLNYLDTLGAVGIYMLALKFGMIIEQLVGEPFSRSYGSFRFSIMKQDNAAQIQAKIFKYLFYLVLFMALGISLFIGEVLKVMSDPAFWPAATIMPLLMLSSMLKILNYPVQTGVLYAKKTKYFVYTGVIGAVVSATANLSLVPLLGIYGACISLILTNSVLFVTMHLASQKYFKVDYPFGRMLIAFVIAAAIYLVSFLLPEQWFVSIPIKIALMLIFIALLFSLKVFLEQDERDYVKKLIQQKILRTA